MFISSSSCKLWVMRLTLVYVLLFTTYSTSSYAFTVVGVQRIHAPHSPSISTESTVYYHSSSLIPTNRRWPMTHLSNSINTSATSLVTNTAVEPTTDWELDCYSRPVMIDGKKLWEVLITDSSGSFRLCETLPSSKVNSRELRRVIDMAIERAEVKPNIIRFFRSAMFNMINIALSEVDVISKPSRCTYALADWIEERNRNVYPKMDGYRPNMVGGSNRASFLDVRTPVKLPDALRGEKYAFVSLPLTEFLEGGGITKNNIGVGKLCVIDRDLPKDSFVQGIAIFTSRADALSSWLAGTEVSGFKADLRKRTLVMETDMDNEYLMAKLTDTLREEGAAFEEGKENLRGLHFISVQVDDDSDPAGFWLLKEFPSDL